MDTYRTRRLLLHLTSALRGRTGAGGWGGSVRRDEERVFRRVPRLFAVTAASLVLVGTAAAGPDVDEPPKAGDAGIASEPGDPVGWLDAVDGNGVARGWTCDPDNFSQPLHVHFYVDGPAGSGTLVGHVYADLMREPAVGDFCGGWRNHGYSWQLPGWLWDGQWHRLYVHAISVGPGNHVLLQGSGLWFRLGGSSPIGWLDLIDGDGVVHGWACDADNFSQPLYVHFYVDGSLVGDVYANVTREPAVGDFCGGWRNHGFHFILPESVRDSQSRTLSVWAINLGSGQNVQLSGSPRGFRLDPSLESETFEWGEWGIEAGPSEAVEPGAANGAESGTSQEADAVVPEDVGADPAEGAEAGTSPGAEADVSRMEAGSAEEIDAGRSNDPAAEPSPVSEADAAKGEEPSESPSTSTTRCEWHNFEAKWKQTRAYTVLTYRGYFRVCYIPNDRIVSVTNMWGDASWVCGWCGWRWLGNAGGYPTHSNFGSRAVLRYRGSLQFCPPHFWCIGTRQPWVEITFHPNGTKKQVIGVA